eukprot:7922710-Heterocapsa_arctica.AAC.1
MPCSLHAVGILLREIITPPGPQVLHAELVAALAELFQRSQRLRDLEAVLDCQDLVQLRLIAEAAMRLLAIGMHAGPASFFR